MTRMCAAVAVLGALSVFHLALTMGIIRRLRSQDAQLARLNSQGSGGPAMDTG